MACRSVDWLGAVARFLGLLCLVLGISMAGGTLQAEEILPGDLSQATVLPLTEQEYAWLQQHPRLKVAVKNGWMPVEFQLENHNHAGVSVQYLEKISQLTGLTFVLVNDLENITPAEALLRSGIRGQNPPAGFQLLEQPYLVSNNAIYMAAHHPLAHHEVNLGDLAGKTVAVFKGGSVAQKLKQAVPTIKIKLIDIADEAFEYLASGYVDAYVGNELVLDYHLDLHKIDSIKKVGVTAITSDVWMAVDARQPLLISILNKATQQIGTNPPEIMNTWKVSPAPDHTQYLIAIPGILVLLLLLQLLNVYRKSKKQAVAAQREIWFQANHDFLTKLPNRFQLKHEIDQAMQLARQSKQSLGVIIIDLDNFKQINDTAGHSFGDEVLIQVARRIQSVAQPPSLTARFGGDEFLIMIPSGIDQQGLHALCEQLLRVMALPLEVQSKSVSVSMSIGAALFPDHGQHADELIMFADQALYQAKKAGKHQCVLFNQAIYEEFVRKTQLTEALKSAISAQQLSLHYQPIFNLTEMRCEKLEALLRWHHPQLGTIPPDIFIPIAEENNFIITLGEWVFAQAIRDLPQIQHQFGKVEICLNISPLQFARPGNIEHFLLAIHARNIPGNQFCFEITERLLLELSPNTMEMLERLHNVGIKLAIDDFGTGYSSLAYLHKFMIDYVKIDKSFISRLTDNEKNQALCKTMIYMGNQLNIKLIAEGVETVAQETLLKQMGCHYSQGYLRAKPAPLGSV
ncbi:EAL domain-containing protein [Methylophilus sp. 3sh_L]|uniref:EAL domain-containing protein n=1 Tax=Methylophilus sp. 3sh_L TaxID=3377114 RepID=UPI00398F125B